MRAWLVCGLVLLALAAMPVSAADLSIENLSGRWCQPGVGNYTFTRTRLTVARDDGATKVLEIASVKAGPDSINVIWKETGQGTVFYKFSPDGRQMFQKANTGGMMGPERAFHRC